MLTVLLWVSVAWAGVTSPVLEVEVKVKAKVSQDLRTITGTIEADPTLASDGWISCQRCRSRRAIASSNAPSRTCPRRVSSA